MKRKRSKVIHCANCGRDVTEAVACSDIPYVPPVICGDCTVTHPLLAPLLQKCYQDSMDESARVHNQLGIKMGKFDFVVRFASGNANGSTRIHASMINTETGDMVPGVVWSPTAN